MNGKRPSESETIMTSVVMPGDTNTHGTLFGGTLLSLIDKAAAVCTARHCRKPVVTVAIDRVEFLEPIRMGDFVTVRARLNFVGRSSMEVGVDVQAEEPQSGTVRHPVRAILTFVAVEEGHRVPVPPLVVETEEERERFEQGRMRYEARKSAPTFTKRMQR